MFGKSRSSIVGPGDPLGLARGSGEGEGEWDGEGWVKFYSMGAEKAMERMKKMVKEMKLEKERERQVEAISKSEEVD